MRIAVLILLIALAPTSRAEACEPKPFAPCLDGLGESIGDGIGESIGKGFAEIMLYTLFAGADVAVLVRDVVAPEEKARAVATVELLVGVPQAAVFGYRLFADDDATVADAIFAAGGTLLVARGIYLAVRPGRETAQVMPAIVGGRPGMSVSGTF